MVTDVSSLSMGFYSFIDKLDKGEIYLSPYLRSRYAHVPIKDKSRVIELILMGLPLPSIYLSADATMDRLVAVNEIECLCAIYDFFVERREPMSLDGLALCPELRGMTCRDLPRGIQEAMAKTNVVACVLGKAMAATTKFEIMRQLAATEHKMDMQELRYALNMGGVATDMMVRMTQLPSFMSVIGRDIPRSADGEWASRFVAFYGGYYDYDGDVERFMNDRIGRLSRMEAAESESMLQSFDKALKTAYYIFGQDTFWVEGEISKQLFDTLCANLAWLDDSERRLLMKSAINFKQDMDILLSDDRFKQAISTDDKMGVARRFYYVKNLIQKYTQLAEL